MRVIYKPTGQLGEIPDDKFDANLFSMADQPATTLGTSTSKIVPPTTNPEQQARGGLFSNTKSLGEKAARFLAPATMNIAQDWGQGDLVSKMESSGANKQSQAWQQQLADLAVRAKNETNPEKKARLLEIVRQGMVENQKVNAMNQPGFSEDVNKSAIERGLGSGAELATTFMVPSAGKGGTALSRVASMAGQGATSAGIRTATSTQDMTPKERVKATAKAALIGGVVVGGLQGLGEAYTSWRGSLTNKLKEAGSDIKTTQRGIRVTKGYNMATEEKAINSTAERLGFSSDPNVAFKQFPEKRVILKTALDKAVADNANVVVSAADLKQVFVDKLKKNILIGDLKNNAQAQSEVEKFLMELNKQSGGTGKFTDVALPKLVQWKQMINEVTGGVWNKIESGASLTPKEQVAMEAWSAIDDAIKGVTPEVKALLKDQSNLMKLEPMVSRARINPPTLRAGGTSIPQALTNAFQKIKGGLTTAAGNIVERMPNLTPAAIPLVAPTVSQGVLPPITPSTEQQYQETQNQSGNNYATSDLNHPVNNTTTTESLPSINPPTTPSQDAQYITGHSPETLYQAYQTALGDNNTKAATQLKTYYDDEVAYQKSGKAKAATVNPMADTALTALTSFKNELFVDGDPAQGMKSGARTNIIESNIDIPVPFTKWNIKSPLKSKYETQLNNLLEVLGRTLTPGNRAPSTEQIQRLKETYFPGSFQDEDAIKLGIENMTTAIENSRYIKPTTDTMPVIE